MGEISSILSILPRPVDLCDGLDNDEDGEADEGTSTMRRLCPSNGVLYGEDDDCDGREDEGVLNACGSCGDVPLESCNGSDDDCDGSVDEGTLNACGGVAMCR